MPNKPKLTLRSERTGIPVRVFADPANLLFPVQHTDDLTEYRSLVDHLPNAPDLLQSMERIAKAETIALPADWETAFAATKGEYGSSSEAGYADPGLQKDKKPRYPLKQNGRLSAKRIRAAWSYINQRDNAAAYSSAALSRIKKSIANAAAKVGIHVTMTDDGDAEFASELDWDDDEDVVVSDDITFELGDDKRTDGDFIVYPQRKLFPAGWFESHDYGMSPEELAIAAFSCPVAALDIDHKDKSIIKDEFLGFGQDFQSAWEGDQFVMRGDIHIHSALDPLLRDETRMSATWGRSDKMLRRIALTLNPKIPDANLKTFSADFARTKAHSTRSGQTALQNLHDHSVRHGAVCDVGNVASDKAMMASKKEHSVIQQIHDMTAGNGAKCESTTSNPIWGSAYYTHDSGSPAGEEVAMRVDATGAEKPKTSPEPEAQMTDREKSLTAQVNKMVERDRRKESAAFARSLVEKEIIKPAHSDLVAAFDYELRGIDASAEDQTGTAEVQFTEKHKTTRTGAFEALMETLKPSRMTSETISLKDPAETRFALTEDVGDTDTDAATRVRDRARKQAGLPARGATAAATEPKGGK